MNTYTDFEGITHQIPTDAERLADDWWYVAPCARKA